MKRIFLSIMMVLSLLAPLCPARAEDVFRLDEADFATSRVLDDDYRAAHLTTAASYVSFSCDLAEKTDVSLSIAREDTGETVYARDYGAVSGAFHTEDVYLRLDGPQVTNWVSFHCGENDYEFPVDRVMARLQDNAACSAGYPLSQLSGKDTWQTVTLLDLSALSGGAYTCDLYASSRYVLGTVTFQASDSGDAVYVSVSFDEDADVELSSAKVYVASTALEAQTLGRKGSTAASGTLDSWIACPTGLAAVYVRLTVSFQPNSLPEYLSTWDDAQDMLWQRMQNETSSEANG